MVLWRSQADEIEALRAEVRNLGGKIAVQQEEMDALVERMVHCDGMAQMQFVLRQATTIAGRRQEGRHEQLVSVYRSAPKAPH